MGDAVESEKRAYLGLKPRFFATIDAGAEAQPYLRSKSKNNCKS
jgi:hypothetical protein